MKILKVFLVMLAVAAAPQLASAQMEFPAAAQRRTLISRTALAVNYGHRGASTKIDFEGTDLLPKANGEAKVESKQGYMEIEVEFDDLQDATKFGNEYMTYVLWAVTPEGRAVNLGEVILNGNRSHLNVTTEFQSFAMVVTAEPYYAVRRPSNVVVLENILRRDTVGKVETLKAQYELFERGGYVATGTNYEPVVRNGKLPLEFYEARNAMRIARAAGAEQYATSAYENANRLMIQADAHAARKSIDKKSLIATSREVVQKAEDARENAVKAMESSRAEADRRASADREADATAKAADEAQRRRSAESDAADATRKQEEAERKNRDAQAAAQLAARAQEEAERARLAAQQQQQAAEAESARNLAAAAAAEQQRVAAEQEREELRARLLEQFNSILATRDTARGLIVNMADVLFDSGKHTLRPLAREKLAKISGIMIAYPGLKLEIEGNTDSVGTHEYNQGLSERRAQTVRSFLTEQGVAAAAMTAVGLGEAHPISNNATAAGRQENRRVELVVSGEVIGTKIGASRLPAEARNPRP